MIINRKDIDKKRKLKNRYDATAEIYDRRYRDIQRRKFQAILEDLGEAQRILDVGCGTGLFIDELAREKQRIVGVDFSSEMLKVAKERTENLNLISADADKLPFRDESFDAVMSLTLLQNMPNPERTVVEMARVTEGGGVIAITSLRHKHSVEKLESWAISANLKPLRTEEIPDSEDVLLVARCGA